MLKGTKVFALIGTTLLFLTLGLGFASADNLVAKGPDVTIQLMDSQCTSQKVATAHPDKNTSTGFTAVVVYQGRRIEACWIANAEKSQVSIIDEDGEEVFLPMNVFQVEKSI